MAKIKFSDLPVLIRSDRRYQIAVIVLILVILWPMLDPSKPKRPVQSARPAEQPTGTGKTPGDEIGADLISVFKTDLDNVNARVEGIEKSVGEQGQNLKDFEERTAQIFKKVLEKISDDQNQQTSTGPSAAPADLNTPEGQAAALESEKLAKWGETEEQAAAPAPPPPAKVAIIGAGDSVRVKLLAGVNAPTDGTPYPVVFKLDGDVLGPDGSTLPLGEARLIAAAQGSLTDQRALFRLTSLNIRMPNGRRKVIGVDGWIVGEDGIRGMSGILIDPIGKALLGAGMTGALQGVGNGIAQSQTTTTQGFGQQNTFVTGSVAKLGAGQGLSSAATLWSDIIKDRLDQLVPVVQVLSGRESTAIFAKSVTIPDLFDAIEEDDANFQFASMD